MRMKKMICNRQANQPQRSKLSALAWLFLALVSVVPCQRAAAAGPVKVRLATLAPKGSSYTRHLQVMGEEWRKAPGGGAQLTIYPDGTMGSEADMIRRMRLGQLQAAMVTSSGIAEIEKGVELPGLYPPDEATRARYESEMGAR